jgi:hypothetical protein
MMDSSCWGCVPERAPVPVDATYHFGNVSKPLSAFSLHRFLQKCKPQFVKFFRSAFRSVILPEKEQEFHGK